MGTVQYFLRESGDSKNYLGQIFVYFNIAGIVIVIIFSIFTLKMMAKRSLELDANDDTPGDYSVIVRNIPLDMSKD